jgi:hypothetical protein
MEQDKFLEVFDQYVCSIVASGVVSKYGVSDLSPGTWREASRHALFLMTERKKVICAIGSSDEPLQVDDVLDEYDMICYRNGD